MLPPDGCRSEAGRPVVERPNLTRAADSLTVFGSSFATDTLPVSEFFFLHFLSCDHDNILPVIAQ